MIKSRSKILTTLCLVLVACVCFAIGSITKTKVNADQQAVTPTVDVETILMDEGAQVRFKSAEGEHADKSGIRFTLYVNQQHYSTFTNPVVGMYIARESDLTTEFDMSTPEKAPASAKHFIANSVAELAGDDAETIQDTYSLKGVLYGAPESEYGVKLVANGYIKEADTDISTVNFPGTAQTRSIAQVASAILANGAETDESNVNDLKEYVDKFTAVQANFTMDAAVKTDMYKTAEPTLNVVNPAGLVATWDSSNKEVATVDANGNVTRVGKGETDITATVGNKTVTSKLTITDPAPLIVDENTYKNAYTYDGATYFSTFVDKDSEELSSFTGDYHGNATKFRLNNAHNYWLINDYTAEEISKLSLEYNKVTLWFAVDNIATGYLHLMENKSSFSNKVFSNENINAPGRHTLTSENNKKWEKWEITINQYIALTTGGYVDGSKLLFHAYFDPAAKDPAFSAVEGTEVTFYIGDIEFYFDPYIVKVNSATHTEIHNSSLSQMYIEAGADEIKDFSGEYNGSAKRFLATTNAGYKLNNPYTSKQLESIKSMGYTNVSLYFAHSIMNGTASTREQSNPSTVNSILYSAKALDWSNRYFTYEPTGSQLACGTWYKATITIDQYMSLITGADESTGNTGTVLIMALGGTSGTNTATKYIYVGDIFFEEPTIIDVDPISYTKIFNNDLNGYRSYVDRDTWVSEGITGDYTGNATKFSSVNRFQKYTNPFTEEELNALKDRYTHVSMWWAYTATGEGGSVYLYNAGFEGKFDSSTNVYARNVWYKWTITIDDYIELVSANNYEYLTPTYTAGTTDQYITASGASFYYGDMIFENIAE